MNSVGLVPVRRGDEGVEVLWSRRPDQRRWFGGFWGLPVGRIESNDARIPLCSNEELLDPEVYGAAARELFEEFGLVAVGDTWKHIREVWPDHRPLDGVRRRVREGGLSFSALLHQFERPVNSRLLHPVGAWSTPRWFSSEFSTEFLALTVSGETAAKAIEWADRDEHREVAWRRPREALRGWRAGEAFVTTPIRYVLEALERSGKWRWSTQNRGDAELVVTADWLDDRKDSPRSDIEIASGVRWMALPSQTITATNRTNCWILGHDDVVVIDPGTPYSAERTMLHSTVASLRSEGRSVKAILLTHHHGDHTAAAEWLAGRIETPIWAHAETADRLANPSAVERRLEDGATISLGNGRQLQVWHTPGHAAGHLAFMLRPERHVVAGDLVARGTTVLIDPDEGHMGDYLESLRRLQDAATRAILPGHGHPICHTDEILERYLEHRERRERQILKALRRHLNVGQVSVSPADLVPEVYADAPRRRWPLAMRSLESHLIHLCEQGHAVQEAGEFAAVR